MAPKRRGRPRKTVQPADEDSEKQETSASAEQTIASEEAAEDDDEKADTEPSPKKTKVEEKKTRGRKPKANRKKAAAARKKAAVHEDERESDEEEESEEEVKEEAPANAKSVKVILIEASKECNCFKTRAAKVHAGLTKAIPGIEVQINPDKPRKGCFEVRGQDGTIYLSLLGLPRPFTKLKKLDMDEAIEDIVAKVK